MVDEAHGVVEFQSDKIEAPKEKGAVTRALTSAIKNDVRMPLYHDPTDVACCSGFPSLTTQPSFSWMMRLP